MAERMLYAEECAERAGVLVTSWRSATSANRANRYPRPFDRCPTTGRPRWRESDVTAYLAGRIPRGGPAGQRTHDRIVGRVDGRATEADIAAALGLHPRTVHRHLSGQCVCKA